MATWKKVLTEDNISTGTSLGASDDKIPSQNAVKTYVDTQIDTADALEEMADVNLTSQADASMLLYDTGTSKWIDNIMSGDAAMLDTGAMTINDEAVTYAKMQNVSATNRILGRDSSGAGVVEEIAPSALLTMLNVSDGANANVSGDSGNSAIYDNSGTPTLKAGITQAEMQSAIGGVYTDSNTTTTADVSTALAGLTGDDTLYIGDDGNDATILIRGNLQITGASTTVTTETIKLADNTILLNSNATGTASEDGGIEIERGDDTNQSLIWREGGDQWATYDGTTTRPLVTATNSTADTVPDGDHNGIGCLHVADTDGTPVPYIRVA